MGWLFGAEYTYSRTVLWVLDSAYMSDRVGQSKVALNHIRTTFHSKTLRFSNVTRNLTTVSSRERSSANV
jgi:hypothetical protein